MICEKQALRELIIDNIPTVKLSGVDLFDVEKVFDCGQCFRFDKVTSPRHSVEYAGCALGKYISVAQDGDTLYIYNTSAEEYYTIWQKYLGLDHNYREINLNILSLSSNKALRDAVLTSSGIRILKQNEWEAVCSFIISQNNNIPRIKKLVDALCRRCGDMIDISNMQGHIADSHQNDDMTVYSFPSPSAILNIGISGLTELKMGFRAKYIYDAATKFECGQLNLNMLRTCPSTDECIAHLRTVNGIGPKVASCALLFGFARLDAFPIDVWIKKVMIKYFDENFDPHSLGQYAGIAQQYLFYYERYLQSKAEE